MLRERLDRRDIQAPRPARQRDLDGEPALHQPQRQERCHLGHRARRVAPTAAHDGRLAAVVDETCELHDTVFVSGGRRGLDVGIAPSDLVAVTGALVAAITA